MKRLMLIVISCFFALTSHASTLHTPLSLLDGWVRAAPSVAKVMAGYGRLINATSEPLRIESLSSPGFERVELHEMSMNDGVMKMRRRDPITLEPNQELSLEPGGWHLMLIGPKTPQPAGQQVEVEITTDQGVYVFSLPVREPKP